MVQLHNSVTRSSPDVGKEIAGVIAGRHVCDGDGMHKGAKEEFGYEDGGTRAMNAVRHRAGQQHQFTHSRPSSSLYN